jgi:hypothetical protein
VYDFEDQFAVIAQIRIELFHARFAETPTAHIVARWKCDFGLPGESPQTPFAFGDDNHRFHPGLGEPGQVLVWFGLVAPALPGGFARQ